ncbi:unnamed protein product [Owenia fusiformis]|uniref:Uncharacterized protein n=1 Tax=Owenia fusiformis TaxID=6347 RepID=A0A8J1XNE5_OWEFU|nr:unnamed protein product [Owenia fusiformis]
MQLVAVLIAGVLAAAHAQTSFFPTGIFGEPVQANVVALREDKPDYRGTSLYQIQYLLKNKEGKTVSGFVHRSYAEFKKLNDARPWKLFGYDFDVPTQGSADVDSMNDYLAKVMKDDALRKTDLVSDFLGINWDASDIKWFADMETFLEMLLTARVPEFAPEPPTFGSVEDAFRPETPFEAYVYVKAFRHGGTDATLAAYVDFFKNYTDTTPSFSGPAQDVDVLPPSATKPISIPYHYAKTFVHFLPGGYLNGHTVRISYLGKNKFNLLNKDNLVPAIKRFHGDRKPKRILDVGTGNCFSALGFAQVFPDAEVIGVDLAAPYIRFCRLWANKLGVKNVKFYQDNGEDLSWPDNHFDIVQYTYVLHEMPAVNARRFLSETLRVLKPGGVMSGFEVPFHDDPVEQVVNVASQTWGYRWNTTGPHGPEPYMREYEEKTELPKMIESVGFVKLKHVPYTYFEAFYLAEKKV